MKKLLCSLSFGIALAMCANALAANKIAITNISTIFEQLPQRVIVAQQLEKEFKARAEELQNEEKDLQMKIEKLQRDGSTMKSSDRKRLENDISIQKELFSNKLQSFEDDQHNREIEERNKLLIRIQKAVKKVAEKGGYDLIIDSNVIAYAHKIKDITADVLKQVK